MMTVPPRPHPPAELRGIRVDVFCRVIDNLGDLGVCWRLARQLSREYGAKVQLIVDVLAPFTVLEPRVDISSATQSVDDISIVRWDYFERASASCACDLAIEAFACDPPQRYIESMATRATKPVWINLEYLSAEDWVDGVHGLPSPHPRLPLTKYFFVPGFSEESGGLIRECAIPSAREGEATLRTLSFTYPRAPVRALARGFAHAGVPFEISLAAKLEDADPNWQTIAPVPQTEFDALLGRFDLLLVRGEDSFVRAQLAGKPMLWHIYPTEDRAHLKKLDAWLDCYCERMNYELATTYRRASHAFVDLENEANPENAFAALAHALPRLREHASRWRDALFTKTDLAVRLIAFYESKAAKPRVSHIASL
jgi:hypothetical protein